MMLLFKNITALIKLTITERLKVTFERFDAFNSAARGGYYNNSSEMRHVHYQSFKREYSGFIADRNNLIRDRENVTRDINSAFDTVKLTYKL